MSETILKKSVWVPRDLPELFPFFANAENLGLLTPSWLKFEILTPRPIEMRVGALIDYRIRLRGFPMRWRTEITAWNPPFEFVDEQRRGPYRLWRHRHWFEERDGGTVCHDEVRYIPFGGWLADRLFVRRDVERIFAYREQRMREVFAQKTWQAGVL